MRIARMSAEYLMCTRAPDSSPLAGFTATGTRYNLEVKVSKTSKGKKEMTVKCGGHEFGYVDNDLPDSFYAGIVGCEGRNRFYDFKMR